MPRAALIALLPDGKEGSITLVQGTVTIGRDKTSTIRASVPTISRQHAKVLVNENGKLCYIHLSSVNPSMINGEVVRESVLLKHGDLVHLGPILYQVHNPVPESPAKAQAPALDTIVEQHEDEPVAKKGLPTPLKRSIHEVGSKEKKAQTPKKAPKGLPTPLRKAIQDRAGQVVDEPEEAEAQVMHIRFESPDKTGEAPVVKSIDYASAVKLGKKKTFMEELRDAIASRRLPSPATSPAKTANATGLYETTGTRLPDRSAQTPMKNAIRARVQQMLEQRLLNPKTPTSSESLPAPVAVTTTQAPSTPVATVAQENRLALMSPIRRAINARRKSHGADDKKRKMATPLRSAIHARALAKEEEQQPAEVAEVHEEEAESSGSDIVHRPASFPTPLRKAIEQRRRISLAPVPAPVSSPVPAPKVATPKVATPKVATPKVATPKAASPKARPSKRRFDEVRDEPSAVKKRIRVDEEVLETEAEKIVQDAPMPAAEDPTASPMRSPSANVLEAPLSAKSAVAASPLLAQEVQKVDAGEETEDEAEEVEAVDAALSEDALFAAAVQITKEVMQKEVQAAQPDALLDFEHTVALLASPSFASPRRQSMRPRHRESLLFSLEKKGKGSEGAQTEEDMSDLIANLTDEDMALIETYASRLPRHGDLDDDEIFAIALDAYIRGVEQAIALQQSTSVQDVLGRSSMGPADTDPSFSNCPEAPAETCPGTPLVESVDAASAVEIPAPVEMSVPGEEAKLSAIVKSAPKVQTGPKKEKTALVEVQPLNELFRLPVDYLDALSSELDDMLVEAYAREIQALAWVDNAVAFGVAMDTFVADPVLFRHRVGKLALPQIHVVALRTRAAIEAEVQVEESEVEQPEAQPSSGSAATAEQQQSTETVDPAPVEPVVDMEVCSEPAVRSAAAPKTTPTARSKKEQEVETAQDAPKTAPRGRGKKMVADIEGTAETAAEQTAPVRGRAKRAVAPESESEPEAPKRGRGRSAAVKTSDADAEPVSPPKRARSRAAKEGVEAQTPVIKKTRGGRGVKAETDDSEVEVPVKGRTAKAKAAKVESEEMAKATRGGRSKRDAEKVEPKGRGKRATKEEEESSDDEEESDMEEVLAILCDGCDEEFFMDEVGLDKVPEGDWFCAACTKTRKAKPAAPARKTAARKK